MTRPLMHEQTTRLLTTAVVVGPGAEMFKPRAGNRLRLIEEPIPREEQGLERTKGAPRTPGP